MSFCQNVCTTYMQSSWKKMSIKLLRWLSLLSCNCTWSILEARTLVDTFLKNYWNLKRIRLRTNNSMNFSVYYNQWRRRSLSWSPVEETKANVERTSMLTFSELTTGMQFKARKALQYDYVQSKLIQEWLLTMRHIISIYSK